MGCTQSPDLFSTLLKCKLSAAGAAGFSLTQRTTAANLRRYFKPLQPLLPLVGDHHMTVRVGIIMDPIAQIAFKKDSSLAMLLAAQDRGWTIYYMEQRDLYQLAGEARARMRPIQVFNDPQRWYETGEEVDGALADLNVILMRKDPPFNSEYVYATYLLELAEQAGTLVVNSPQSLRDCNEKFFATQFPQCTPPTLVSRRSDILREFAREQRDIILKPLDEMGGASIFRHREGDPNLSVILEVLTEHGSRQIMAQRYIPAISEGDKRILMIDGEPVPYCLARIPAAGETRGNLAAGGRGVAQPLSERDKEIAAIVGPELRKRGLLFVGLDVIGDFLTEINITSPTCIREIDNAFDTRIGERLMDAIAAKLSRPNV
jgi:glutathione synthase